LRLDVPRVLEYANVKETAYLSDGEGGVRVSGSHCDCVWRLVVVSKGVYTMGCTNATRTEILNRMTQGRRGFDRRRWHSMGGAYGGEERREGRFDASRTKMTVLKVASCASLRLTQGSFSGAGEPEEEEG